MISYLDCFKLFFRLEGVLGAEIKLQIDLTFSVLTVTIRKIVSKVLEFPVSPFRVFQEVIRLNLLNWQSWLMSASFALSWLKARRRRG